MAFATDAQRRWFFAHLAGGMRRIAGKMRDWERSDRPESPAAIHARDEAFQRKQFEEKVLPGVAQRTPKYMPQSSPHEPTLGQEVKTTAWIRIPGVGTVPAKSLSKFKVGESMVFAGGERAEILSLEKTTGRDQYRVTVRGPKGNTVVFQRSGRTRFARLVR